MISFQKRLIIGAISFMLFIIALVIGCLKQNYFLVAKDYYRQEINYQQHIDKVNNSRSKQKIVDFKNHASAGYVKFQFPHLLEKSDLVKGKITFFRPSDARKDVIVPIDLKGTNQQAINVESLEKGLWKVKVDWIEEGEAYYNDFTLIMP